MVGSRKEALDFGTWSLISLVGSTRRLTAHNSNQPQNEASVPDSHPFARHLRHGQPCHQGQSRPSGRSIWRCGSRRGRYRRQERPARRCRDDGQLCEYSLHSTAAFRRWKAAAGDRGSGRWVANEGGRHKGSGVRYRRCGRSGARRCTLASYLTKPKADPINRLRCSS